MGRFGGYTDAETGLTLLSHRFYDPATGRFLTRDPLGYAGGLNLYAYSLNDPVGRADPSGLSSGGAGGGPSDSDPYDPDGNWDGLGMTSGHDGTRHGTAQSGAANQMLDGLQSTLAWAGAGPMIDEAGAIIGGSIDLGGAIEAGIGDGNLAKEPLDADAWAFGKNPNSQPLGPGAEPGDYVYVRDTDGVVHIAPNGPHQHPGVLGGGQSATGAGTLTIGPDGTIISIDNVSGTFQFGGDSLPGVIKSVINQGGKVAPGAGKIFQW